MTVFSDLTGAMSSIALASFGETGAFHLEGRSAPIDATGVFTAAHQEVDASTGAPISMAQAARYLIVDQRPDGHGFLKLMLHKGGGHETSSQPDFVRRWRRCSPSNCRRRMLASPPPASASTAQRRFLPENCPPF